MKEEIERLSDKVSLLSQNASEDALLVLSAVSSLLISAKLGNQPEDSIRLAKRLLEMLD